MPRKKKRAIAVIAEPENMTAIVLASRGLDNVFYEIHEHTDLLKEQTRIIRDTVDNVEHVTIIDNPDLFKWTKLKVDVLLKIAEMRKDVEQKSIENKLDAANIVMTNLDKLPDELKEQFIRSQMNIDKVIIKVDADEKV